MSQADFIALSVAGNGVQVQGADGPPEVVPLARLPAVLAARPAARFVMDNAGPLFGRLLAGGGDGQAAAWAALTGHRVVDVGLADRALGLAGRRDPDPPDDRLLDRGPRRWQAMAGVAEQFGVGTDQVGRFGPLGHGLRVRARAALGAIAGHDIRLRPGARDELIDRCRARVELLEKGVRKAVPELGGHFGRDKRRPDGLLKALPAISHWLAAQVRRLRDTHGAPIYPFLDLTNDVPDPREPDTWPLWALGLPAVPTLAALLAAARLWRDLESAADGRVRPTWGVLPHFRVTAFDLEALPGLDVGRYLNVPDGCIPVRMPFDPLLLAAITWAPDRDGGVAGRDGPQAGEGYALNSVVNSLAARLPPAVTGWRRRELVLGLLRYVASGGAADGLKEYAEACAGVETDFTPGDYTRACQVLSQHVLPELGDYLRDCLIEWVEESLPRPPAGGTLRTLVPPQAATSRAIAEGFAGPKSDWGSMSAFRFHRLVAEHPEWGLRPEVVVNRGPLANYRIHCTRPVVSPAGLVRPHLPWWANRAEAWRTVFDEAALNVIARLAAAGHRLAWASDRGVWLNVPIPRVAQDGPRIEQLANKAASDILKRRCHLTLSWRADA